MGSQVPNGVTFANKAQVDQHKNSIQKQAEITNEMLRFQNREVRSTNFGFQKDLHCLIMTKKNNLVVLMSTFHHDGNINKETSTKWQLEMKTFNNKAKGRVDVSKVIQQL